MEPVTATALNAFLRGLPDEIGRAVEARDPERLVDALDIALRVETRLKDRPYTSYDFYRPSYERADDYDYRSRYHDNPNRNRSYAYPRYSSPVRAPETSRNISYSRDRTPSPVRILHRRDLTAEERTCPCCAHPQHMHTRSSMQAVDRRENPPTRTRQEYLRQEHAEISFANNTLVTSTDPVRPIRFVDQRSLDYHERRKLEPRTYIIKARTRQPIAIDVVNDKLKEGSLPRLTTVDGLYFGEAAVSVNNQGVCHVLAINSLNQDLEFTVPAQELIPFDYPCFPEEQDDTDTDSTPNVTTDRVTEILNRLRLDHLSDEEREHVEMIVEEFPERFHLPSDKLQASNYIKHNIPTIDDIPLNTRQYRFPPIHKQEIERQILTKLSNDIITPSNSPYNSPLWIVPKKPDSKGNPRWRMVIDFRKLNEKTIGDAYPLPNITEILDHIGDAQYFSVFDLASGFQQIEMDSKDRHKTAFSTPNGHYEYIRMPEGLKNAPAPFQRLMDQVLRGLQGIEVFVYLDDIVVYAKNLEQHGKKVRRLFTRLADAGLTLQPDKCEFVKTEVAYLGHVISKRGVRPDPKKIVAVKNFPRPKNAKNIRQFLGLAGYYRRFIENFAEKSKPLPDLLKKNVHFIWGKEQKKSFAALRKALCRAPILQYPNFDKPFTLTTDASDFAIGAVLSQEKDGHDLPVAYLSRTLTKPERNYFTTEKECLAVLYAVLHFRPYLYGRKFKLVSDYEPLRWINSIKDPGQRLVRWRLKLRDYEYNFVHKPGKFNTNADALSRNPIVVNELNTSDDFLLDSSSDEGQPASLTGMEESPQAAPLTVKREPPSVIKTIARFLHTSARVKLNTARRTMKPKVVLAVTDSPDTSGSELEPAIVKRKVGRPLGSKTKPRPPPIHDPEAISTRTRLRSSDKPTSQSLSTPLHSKPAIIITSNTSTDITTDRTTNFQSDQEFFDFSPDKENLEQTQITKNSDTETDVDDLYKHLDDLTQRTHDVTQDTIIYRPHYQSQLPPTPPSLPPIAVSTPQNRTISKPNPQTQDENTLVQTDVLPHTSSANILMDSEDLYSDPPRKIEISKTVTFASENLTYYRDNYVHFRSSDLRLAPVSELLVDIGVIDHETLKKSELKPGSIIVTDRVHAATTLRMDSDLSDGPKSRDIPPGAPGDLPDAETDPVYTLWRRQTISLYLHLAESRHRTQRGKAAVLSL
ncbi:uncharacterized protein LOC123988679 [Osmia bicornis bicornis]|uniref:uncharacterized protein LOC123988679 n=1 Tax=Osmia bicornis bicornis TaxID=1437191 RepID=UPI001EAF1F3A|nr:uncharacterized protein LOC123988679 [Osmia bicornis bicornis]